MGKFAFGAPQKRRPRLAAKSARATIRTIYEPADPEPSSSESEDEASSSLTETEDTSEEEESERDFVEEPEPEPRTVVKRGRGRPRKETPSSRPQSRFINPKYVEMRRDTPVIKKKKLVEKHRKEKWTKEINNRNRNGGTKPGKDASSSSSAETTWERPRAKKEKPADPVPEPAIKKVKEEKDVKEKIYLPIPQEIQTSIQLFFNVYYCFRGVPVNLVEAEFKNTYPSYADFSPRDFGYANWEDMLRNLKAICQVYPQNKTPFVKGLPFSMRMAQLVCVDEDKSIFQISVKPVQ